MQHLYYTLALTILCLLNLAAFLSYNRAVRHLDRHNQDLWGRQMAAVLYSERRGTNQWLLSWRTLEARRKNTLLAYFVVHLALIATSAFFLLALSEPWHKAAVVIFLTGNLCSQIYLQREKAVCRHNLPLVGSLAGLL